MPQANRLTIHILAAFAEHEREAISQRTKGALQAARKRGTRLGNPRWSESIAQARQIKDPIPPAPQLVEMMRRHRAEGITLRAIAAQLNGLGLRTPKDRSGMPRLCGKRCSFEWSGHIPKAIQEQARAMITLHSWSIQQLRLGASPPRSHSR